MADHARLRAFTERPRVFVTSDIGNEPDDAQSLVRILLYGNELDIQGLVACTSTWLRKKVCPERMHKIVEAYGTVVDNLNAHVHPDNPYPPADQLLPLIKTGPALYGKEALGPSVPLSEGSALLIDRLDASERPLWVLGWGGANVIAQALDHVRRTRAESDAARLRAKLRVYTISDQDDTGLWIRVTFPDVFYICSLHAWGEYGMAAWVGISGDRLTPLDAGGPDSTMITDEWLQEHIQIGPLGKVYPKCSYIMEGDSPTFLYLIQNGLSSPENPHWGSWGGRYALVDVESAAKHYADAKDAVIGKNGSPFRTNQATIWRWRDAYQNDFAARMQWTLSNDRATANHAPVVVVNDSTAGPEPLFVEAEASSEMTLDASKTYDPDGDELSFRWFQYNEPTSSQSRIHWPKVPEIVFEPVQSESAAAGSIVKVKLPPAAVSSVDIRNGIALDKGQMLHLILEVKDNGSPNLITYKRVVVQVTNYQGLGASGIAYDTIAEATGLSTG
jgi:hypothetical protein